MFRRDRPLSWGKYKHVPMEKVPTNYLEWMVENGCRSKGSWKKWMKHELVLRNKLLITDF